MSKSRDQYNYNLSNLTEFNPALIYGFEEEASVANLSPDYDPDKHPIEFLIHGINQHEDMFNAYYYAQETILKGIREKGIQSITAAQLITWLKEIHKRISLTLSEDIKRIELSGAYTPNQVFRWHQTGVVGNALQARFLGVYSQEQLIKVINENGLDVKTANAFVDILHKIHHRKDLSVPYYERSMLDRLANSPAFTAMATTAKLAAAYHQDKLTSSEKTTLERVVKICCPPPQIEARMESFANKLVSTWKQCDKDDLNQVSELCRMAFYEFTDIHPFFNANGRTATCLMNIILRSLSHESILMRNPGDNGNESSSYSQAIKFIDTKPELLRAHLLSRITDADKKLVYKDEMKEKIAQLRMDILKTVAIFQREFPAFNLTEFWHKQSDLAQDVAIQLALSDMSFSTMSEDTLSLVALTCFNPAFTKKLGELRASQKPTAIVSPIMQRQYTANEKQMVLNKLNELTGLAGWKASAKNGLDIWIELDSTEKANSIVALLKPLDAFKVAVKTNSNTKNPVIFINQINPEKLEKAAVLANSLKQEAEKKVVGL